MQIRLHDGGLAELHAIKEPCMKTVAILSQKGGTGKTTLSLHLAVAAEQAGKAAVVIDLDPQASASAWKDIRQAETPEVVSVAPGRFLKALEATRESGLVALALIDTAPHSQDIAYSAAKVADLVLIPCRHGFLDVTAIGATAEIVERAGRAGYVVFNHMPPRATNILADVTAAVTSYGLKVAPVTLHQRASYGNALTAGKTAQEYEPESKAQQEITALSKWLHKTLQG
jgi:chromosome partitioning protein